MALPQQDLIWELPANHTLMSEAAKMMHRDMRAALDTVEKGEL